MFISIYSSLVNHSYKEPGNYKLYLKYFKLFTISKLEIDSFLNVKQIQNKINMIRSILMESGQYKKRKTIN